MNPLIEALNLYPVRMTNVLLSIVARCAGHCECALRLAGIAKGEL